MIPCGGRIQFQWIHTEGGAHLLRKQQLADVESHRPRLSIRFVLKDTNGYVMQIQPEVKL